MNKRRILRVFPVLLAVALACELLIFNLKPLCSLGRSWTALPEPVITGSLAEDCQLSLQYNQLNRVIDWCHISVDVRDSAGNTVETELVIQYSDDGSQSAYPAGTVRYTAAHDRASYFRVNGYGRIHDLTVLLRTRKQGCSYRVTAAEINGSVPFRVSLPRIAGIFALLTLFYVLRPSSPLHDNRVWNRRRWSKAVCVLLILCLNAWVLLGLARSNTAMVRISEEPSWAHHSQYAKLARAFSEGKTWIDTPEQAQAIQLLSEMENPYDPSLRAAVFSEHNAVSPWDTAFYHGHLYVYFGAVPVLLSYLPFYLLTGRDLPTVYAAWLSFVLVLIAAFACMRALTRRFFPRLPFSSYVLLSVLLGNGTGVLCSAVNPSFYVVPIGFAQAFALLALALWLSAAERWERALGEAPAPADPDTLCFGPPRSGTRLGGIGPRVVLGSLMAALVAGCRPQFLVFSGLALPIFGPFLRKEPRRGRIAGRIVLFALPYLAVAIPLMYYNLVRFGSPFDFGANYNLTTNDMPHRGFRLTRLPDGMFAYLLELPNIQLQFPYLHPVSAAPIYLGKTVSETMFGGSLPLFPFLWLLFLARRARGALREKRLWLFFLLPLALTGAVVIADTEMAGILWRYTADYLALPYLSAILVFCALLEQAKGERRARLLVFLTAAVGFTLAACLLISLSDASLNLRAPEAYYRLRDLLSWG